MNQSRHLLGVAALLLAVGSVAVMPAPASATATAVSARARPGGRCQAAIQNRKLRQDIYRARQWRITCVDKITVPGFAGAVGLTLAGPREILLVDSAPRPDLVLAHELGHAFSWDRMPDAERQRFARHVGRAEFYGGSRWATMPAEIWANNQARCAGYRNLAPTRNVSCRLMRRYILLARTSSYRQIR